MKKILAFSSALFALPLLAFAQSSPTLKPLYDFVLAINGLLSLLVPILVAAALVVFFWGLVQYLLKAGGGKGAKAGRSLMLWGLIALFVMVSVWGIISLAQRALGVEGGSAQSPAVPGINGRCSDGRLPGNNGLCGRN